MSYNLFLDDFRNPGMVSWIELPNLEYITVKNYEEFVSYITANGLPNFVAFDHDLCEEHYNCAVTQEMYDYGSIPTGLECAKFLVEYCVTNKYKLPEFIIHSANPAGVTRIQNYLDYARKSLPI
jgi:hypothetical protein